MLVMNLEGIAVHDSDVSGIDRLGKGGRRQEQRGEDEGLFQHTVCSSSTRYGRPHSRIAQTVLSVRRTMSTFEHALRAMAPSHLFGMLGTEMSTYIDAAKTSTENSIAPQVIKTHLHSV